mgnify:CR=1 FL=1|jgi:23S rRNA pseudouridine2605 synthase|tara:strand:- start:226 stop:1047 length:822 start_codon:yes stop_codon:yes gene_type:complete
MKQRLHKILASAGVASRRKAEQLIAEGRVQVNGETAKVGDFSDPDTDDIVADGNQVSAEQKRYLLLNKPTGYVTTVTDPHGRPTVMDLVDVRERVYPIGRLDTDTEGLLLLTNDGNFSQRMAHPRFEIEKTYRAELRSSLSPEGEMLLVRGIRLEDGPTAPAQLRVVSKRRRRVDITIHEGRNRIVRRMFASVGSPVTRLRRISFGTLNLDDVPKGRWRELQGKEVDALLKLAAEMVRPKRRQRPTGSVGERGGGGNRASGTRRRATSGARRS